jgi:signal transduction histidine kinase
LGGVMGYAQLIALKNPELKGLNIINEQAGKISKYLSLLGEKWQTETNYDKTIINLKNLIEREAEYLNFNLYYKHQVEKNFVLEMVPSIHGVYRHFSQVFHHLMQNALHSVYESPKKCIEVSLQKIAHEIVLRIKDSGAGLHQEDFAKIFTLGYTTKPKPWEVEEPEIPSGLGLGLFIVNEILKSYQAKINIESKVNAGTTVTVEIPLEN